MSCIAQTSCTVSSREADRNYSCNKTFAAKDTMVADYDMQYNVQENFQIKMI